MKVEARVLEYESNVQGESVAMSIDQSALSHIMSVLTDLYSDPELAVLREYATNALDAHVEAAVSRPIEVTLPTSLSPFVRIRDYGNGLDAKDIRDVFSRYGTSTKRESDDVVGMLGLGCKSALSYSDQFTFTGVKDGVRTEVLVSRDEDGAGTMSIVSEEATDEPSGTEIVVPAKSSNRFEEKADGLFRFWTEGTILVNGSPPERISGVWLSDSLLLTTETDSDFVVQGNVPYPVPVEYDSRTRLGWSQGYRTVRFVEIGSVSFTPSREALQLTKRTKSFLEALATERDSLVQSECGRLIADAPSSSDAIRIQRECRALGYKGKGVYDGREVPTGLDRKPRYPNGNLIRHDDPADDPAKSFLVHGAAYGRKNGSREWTSDFDILHIFTGYDSKELTPTKREKIASYLEGKGLATRGKIVLVSALTPDESYWTKGIPVADWSVVDAIKIDRANRPAILDGRPRGAYPARVAGVWTEDLQAEDIDPTKPLYWLHGSQGTIAGHPARRENMLPEDATVVALGANRIDKFVRDFPSAIQLDEAARMLAKDWTSGLDSEDVRSYVFKRDADFAVALSRLDADAISDPELATAVRLASRETTKIEAGVKRFRGFLPVDFAKGGDARSPLADYALLRSLLSHSPGGLRDLAEETTIYVNASYEARSKGADSAPESEEA